MTIAPVRADDGNAFLPTEGGAETQGLGPACW